MLRKLVTLIPAGPPFRFSSAENFHFIAGMKQHFIMPLKVITTRIM